MFITTISPSVAANTYSSVKYLFDSRKEFIWNREASPKIFLKILKRACENVHKNSFSVFIRFNILQHSIIILELTFNEIIIYLNDELLLWNG